MNDVKVRVELSDSEIIDGTLQEDAELAHFISILLTVQSQESETVVFETIVEVPSELDDSASARMKSAWINFLTLFNGVEIQLSKDVSQNLAKQLNIDGMQSLFHISDLDFDTLDNNLNRIDV